MVASNERLTEQSALVAFADLTGYAQVATSGRTPRELLNLMNAYFEVVGELVEPAGGVVVKCLGDAALIVFPIERTDAGVQALLRLKIEGDAWLGGQGLTSTQQIKVHVGPVARAPVGTRTAKHDDVYGNTVNIAARLPGNGLTLSPETFRELRPETRQRFKRHTAQVVYIRHEDRRPPSRPAGGSSQ
jgi:adenylate cyclase